MYALFFVRTMNNKKLKEALGYLIIIVVVVLFRTFLYSPIRVTGDSMVPTLKDGNIMILDKIGYRINGVKRFDIVVVHYNGGNIIKRVIGLPGDYIEYKDDKLYINNKLVNEEYKRDVTNDFSLSNLGYDKIPEGKYLVLGDNRGISKDSRIIGLVDKKDIMGYTSIVIFPFTEIRNANKK